MERIHGRTVSKKNLNEPDYYDGVVSHPESDFLESEVKWALGSTSVNKASGCDGIPVELFKTLKDDAIKVLHSIFQQVWKTSSGHRTGKGQSSSQFPRRVVLKNMLTAGQLHSSPMLMVQFICSVTSNPLLPHGLQHGRLSCSSATPRACSNSCPSSR